MAAKQVDHLVKMANQIALNLAAWGDDDVVARKTGEHMKKFWTPAMLQQLIEFQRSAGHSLSPIVCRALASMDEKNGAGGPTT